MSQVVKAIVATDSGQRKFIPKGLSPLFTDVFASKSEVSETYSTEGSVGILYRIGTKIGADCIVTDYERVQSDNALQHAIVRTKRQVIEGIFGEFRPHFRRIEKAIYNHNMEEAGRLLHEMEYQMFEEIE
jgi:hypothetical protein